MGLKLWTVSRESEREVSVGRCPTIDEIVLPYAGRSWGGLTSGVGTCANILHARNKKIPTEGRFTSADPKVYARCTFTACAIEAKLYVVNDFEVYYLDA